jgi:hypothetical protein
VSDRQDPFQAVPDLIGGPPDVVIETSAAPLPSRPPPAGAAPGRVVSIGLSGGKQTPIAFDDLVWRTSPWSAEASRQRTDAIR